MFDFLVCARTIWIVFMSQLLLCVYGYVTACFSNFLPVSGTHTHHGVCQTPWKLDLWMVLLVENMMSLLSSAHVPIDILCRKLWELGKNCHCLVSMATAMSSLQITFVPQDHNLETTVAVLNVITLSTLLGRQCVGFVTCWSSSQHLIVFGIVCNH